MLSEKYTRAQMGTDQNRSSPYQNGAGNFLAFAVVCRLVRPLRKLKLETEG
jgi:hypothetical protein